MPETDRQRRLSAAAHALAFVLCATLAFWIVLATELGALQRAPDGLANPLDQDRFVVAAIHLARIALLYSSLAGAIVIAWHVLRRVLARYTRHADAWVVLTVAAASAEPAWRVAYGVTTGGLLSDSDNALPLRIAGFAVLCALYPALWLYHLVLVGELTVRMPTWLSRVPKLARVLSVFALGLALLIPLVDLLDRRLRAYMFVLRFLLPAAWLLGAALVFGAARYLPARVRRGVCAGVALLLAAAYVAPIESRGLRQVSNTLARRQGAAAMADFAVTRHRGAPYAELDFSHPERFKCGTPTGTSAPTVAPANHRNVILISVDALRKDALGWQNASGPVMPQVQALAAQSLVFERAVTTYPATLFALGSALTGRSPSEVLFAPAIPKNVFARTASRFARRFIVLPRSIWFEARVVRELMTQGIQSTSGRDSSLATDSFIASLRSARTARERTFGWIHYYDAHVRGSHGSRDAGPRESYEASVSYVDQEIGRLLRSLRSLGYFDDSLIIVFADHGEALGELGYYGHHVYLNRFIADIPLIVHTPDVKPEHVQHLVAISDIAPTILEWTGARMPASDARGQSAVGDARSLFADADPTRVAFAEAFPLRGQALFDLARRPITSPRELDERMELTRASALDYEPKVSVTSERYRLIVNRDTGVEELYDRERDPHEEDDLASSGLAVQTRLREALRTWAARESERIYCRIIENAAGAVEP